MIRSIFCPKSGPHRFNLTPAEMPQALADASGLLWVSLEQPTEAEINQILHEVFHFHPLAIEDCQSQGYQTPKVDDFGAYLFIIVHAIRPDFPLNQLDTMELNCFLGHNYLVTSFTSPPMPSVQAVWDRLARDERLTNHGADFLCHAILDRLVNEYFPLLDVIDDEIDRLEDEVLANPRQEALEQILSLKHSIAMLRRIVAPQREVMNRLSRDDLPQIAPNNRIYFRDIYDHLVRLFDLSESVRDVITGTLDTYLSVTSNRLNVIMKALTIVSTIFLPLSFVAGVYGMNFKYMPGLEWRYGYLMVWGIFIVIAVSMLLYFWRRGWF